MSEWWELSEEEIADDPHAQAARQIAYVNTFYNSREGNTVLLDIKRLCESLDTHDAGRVALLLLMASIRQRAGANVQTELAMIEAEASAIEFDSLEEGDG